MGTVPNARLDKVQYFQNHVAPWQSNTVAIGLAAGDVTTLVTRATAARTAYEAQQAAMQAAKAATEAFYNAVDQLSVQGAAMIKMIRAKADSTGNPNVYVLAQIPAPPVPAPRPAPGVPYNFRIALNNDGSVELRWDCDDAGAGTVYQVYRSLTGSAGDFSYLGGTGQRKITDGQIPAGTAAITYKIQGVRTSAAGAWGTVNVGFGAGGIVSSSTAGATVKLAA